MTAILADYFQNILYLFADGRTTKDDFIFTDNDEKIIVLSDDSLCTMCGESRIIEQFVALYENPNLEKLGKEELENIHGDGEIIHLHQGGVSTYDIYPPKDTKEQVNSKSTYPHSACPLFWGSGSIALSSAYHALECNKSKTRGVYLERIRKAYKAAAKRISSMGILKQTETIEL